MTHSIAILMYHQIERPPPRGAPLRGLCVSPGAFSRQMRLFGLMGYRGLSMPDLMPYLEKQVSGKVFGITFDDGYVNVLDHALPVLLREGFTATCYAVSHQLGGSNFWDADAGVEQKPLMNIEQWQRWSNSGMDIGSHTMQHRDLTAIAPELAVAEVTNSRKELENTLQVPVHHFCYPYGRFTPDHLAMVATAGYETAVTTVRGRVSLANSTMLSLPRVMIRNTTNVVHAATKLLVDS